MSLLKKTEGQDDTAGAGNSEGAEAGASTAKTETATTKPSAAETAATALAAHQAKSTAVAKPALKVNLHVVKEMKDALRVDFDTLARVQANQGKFIAKETGKSLGDTLTLQLLSWQDNWVCSPNDTEAPVELVKFSDDGVTSKDGVNLLEHLAEIKPDWPNAQLSKRCVIVGALLACEKDQGLVGDLIQIDCSPKSLSQFLRYQANAAYQLSQGKLDEETVKTLRLTAETAEGPKKSTYTLITFQAEALVA